MPSPGPSSKFQSTQLQCSFHCHTFSLLTRKQVLEPHRRGSGHLSGLFSMNEKMKRTSLSGLPACFGPSNIGLQPCFPCLRGEGGSSGRLHRHATFQQPLQPNFPFSSKKKKTMPNRHHTKTMSDLHFLLTYTSPSLLLCSSFFCPEGLVSPWIQDQSLTLSFSQGHSTQRHCED